MFYKEYRNYLINGSPMSKENLVKGEGKAGSWFAMKLQRRIIGCLSSNQLSRLPTLVSCCFDTTPQRRLPVFKRKPCVFLPLVGV
jgi:hypothetical protein